MWSFSSVAVTSPVCTLMLHPHRLPSIQNGMASSNSGSLRRAAGLRSCLGAGRRCSFGLTDRLMYFAPSLLVLIQAFSQVLNAIDVERAGIFGVAVIPLAGVLEQRAAVRLPLLVSIRAQSSCRHLN